MARDTGLITTEDVVVEIRGIMVTLHPEHLAVMTLMAHGLTYCEIGQELGVSRGTIHGRVRDLKNAIGTDSRVEALLLLQGAGMLS